MYAVMAIETEIPWPEDELEILFQGRKIFLRPATEDRRADIVVSYLPGEELNDAACAGNAFLSQLAWQTKMAIRCEQYHGTTFFQPVQPAAELAIFTYDIRAVTFDWTICR